MWPRQPRPTPATSSARLRLSSARAGGRARRALSAVGLLCLVSAATRARGEQADAEPASLAQRAGAADAGSAPDANGVAKSGAIVIEEESDAEPPPPLPVGNEKRAIGEYILGHSDGIHDCYRSRLRDLPTLQGKLYARFQIGPNGHVIGATADGIEDAPLIACVLAEVRKWQFDKPASGGKLRAAYPYLFRPDSHRGPLNPCA